MDNNSFFSVTAKSPHSKARAGLLETAHGKIETPVFMPVGTSASVKAVTNQSLVEIGAQIILGNTYHLSLRPGTDLIGKSGGLHQFMSWNKPLLTDSGGFQVWSLADRRTITQNGVEFSSHIDGKRFLFTPESVMEAQRQIGADIIMAFDECPPYPCEADAMKKSVSMTHNWTERALKWLSGHPPLYNYPQYFFGIIQGGLYRDIRKRSVADLLAMDLPGYALGGLSVGEPIPEIYEITDYCTSLLPDHKPRYVMGMGTPSDLLNLILLGVDMFDCVIPTRNARNGMVWTWDGVLHFKAARYAGDLEKPLDRNCGCSTCKTYSRAYLRHLFKSGEITVMQLASLHNLYFFLDLMGQARAKITEGTFEPWARSLLKLWKKEEEKDE